MVNAMDGNAGLVPGEAEEANEADEAEMFDAAVSGVDFVTRDSVTRDAVTSDSVTDSADSQQDPAPDISGPVRDPVTGRSAARGGEPLPPISDVETAIPEGDAAAVDEGEETGEGETDVVRSQAQVPSWRLAEETTRRREAEAAAVQLAETVNALQMQMASQMPHLQGAESEDSEAVDAAAGDPQQQADEVSDVSDVGMEAHVQDGIRAMRLENALYRAEDRHGKDAFHEAYMHFMNAAAAGDAASYMRVMNAPDVGEAIVQWHNEQRLLHETGGDPSAYRQRIAGELRADPAFRQEVLNALRAEAEGNAHGNRPQAPNTVTQVPPSLSTLPGGGGSPHSGSAEGAYDEEALFREAVRRPLGGSSV